MESADLISQMNIFFRQHSELYGSVFMLGVEKPENSGSQLNAPDQKQATEKQPVPVQTPLTALQEKLQTCQKCARAQSRKNFVFGSGNPDATLFIVGDMPANDDLSGKPFSGAAGKLLDRMLGKMGFLRAEVYLANILKCHPAGKHVMTSGEIETCLPYLEEQISNVKPTYIFCMGNIAALALLGLDGSVNELRTKTYLFRGIKSFVTHHPTALLQDRKLFWDVFDDMKLLRESYDSIIGDKPPMVVPKRD